MQIMEAGGNPEFRGGNGGLPGGIGGNGPERLDWMPAKGLPPECKSGYGLDLETEIKATAVKILNERHPIEVVPTFRSHCPWEFSDGQRSMWSW